MGLNNKDESLSGSDHNRISSGCFFYGTCMVFMMLQAVICVIILIYVLIHVYEIWRKKKMSLSLGQRCAQG